MPELRKVRGLLLAVVLLAGGCGGGGGGDAAPTTAPSTTTTAAAGEKASITVENPGAEPRQALRLQLAEGDASEATMTMAMSTTMEADGESLPGGAIPPIQMTIRSEVVEVDEEADTITTRFSYADVDIVDDGTVDPQTAEAMRSGLAVLDRLSGTATMTTRGEPVSSEFDVPDDVDPNSRQLVEQISQQVDTLTVPLPEEEVGVGAVWRVETSSSLGGIDTELQVAYELKELEGSRYVLGVAYEQTAPSQEAEFPGAPEQATTTVQEYLVTGDGEVHGDLAQLLPASSTMAAAGDVVMLLEDASESVELRQRLEFDVRLESAS